MTKKTKIIVAGIGGVGGYYGGLLAKKYAGSSEVEIYFVARGEHLKQIQNHGLKVIKGTEEFIARPALATDKVNETGIADYVIICTKSYDLEGVIEQLKPCIDGNTILLPLLNGVDAAERIRMILPGTTVLEGCVYIVASLKEAGVVENSGNSQLLYFGLDNITNDRLLLLEQLFRDAGIEAELSDSISAIVWEKFIYISAIATATSYFNCCIGKLLETHQETVISLIEEVKQIAIAKGITIEKEVTSRILRNLKSLPYEATSSMHRDYQNKKQKTEVESLTGYVVREGKKLNIETPVFSHQYKQLISRNDF